MVGDIVRLGRTAVLLVDGLEEVVGIGLVVLLGCIRIVDLEVGDTDQAAGVDRVDLVVVDTARVGLGVVHIVEDLEIRKVDCFGAKAPLRTGCDCWDLGSRMGAVVHELSDHILLPLKSAVVGKKGLAGGMNFGLIDLVLEMEGCMRSRHFLLDRRLGEQIQSIRLGNHCLL